MQNDYLIFVIAPNFLHLNPYDYITQGPGENSAKPIYTRVPSDRLLKGPMSKEWTSTNSGFTALMVELLFKRGQLSSPSIWTLAMLSGLLHQFSESGFKKGTFWDIFRFWKPCPGIPVEWVLGSEGSGFPSSSSPLSLLNLLFWWPCWDPLDNPSPDGQDCHTPNNLGFLLV